MRLPACIDPPGYDAGKKIKGKKRHILVDALGLVLHAIIHPADIQDRDGGILLLATLFGRYPFLKTLFADAGYQGRQFEQALADRGTDHQTPASGQRICSPAQTLDRGAHHRVAQPLSKARQGLGKPQSQAPRILASRLNSPHAAKALQSNIMFPDRLLRIAVASHALAGRLTQARKSLSRLRELDPAACIANFAERAPLPRGHRKAGERAATRRHARELNLRLDGNVCSWPYRR